MGRNHNGKILEIYMREAEELHREKIARVRMKAVMGIRQRRGGMQELFRWKQ